MIRILFFIPTLSHGGAEKVLVNLVNNMDRSVFDITLQTIFDVGENKRFLSPDIKYRSCYKRLIKGNSHIMKLFSPKTLYKHFVKDEYDIIAAYLEGPAARIISGCTDDRAKLVSWIHVQQETRKAACASFRSYKEAVSCYEKFNKIMCVSEYVKNNFMRNFSRTSGVEVLYNTNETGMIVERSKEAVDDYCFSGEIPTVVGVGTLKKSKGFDRLIRIHKQLLGEGIRQNLIILGVGCEENNLKGLINKLGVSDTVTLLGYKDNPYKYIGKCDMFVCSSFAEGFSTAATEALILGVPVVTTDVSGMKEMLGENNEYGIVTENSENALYEGMKQLLAKKDMLSYYRGQALKRAAFFSTENTVKAASDMFKDLLK